jgi:hypothetical protein
VEQTRKLVEQEGVAFMGGALGTPTNTSIPPICLIKQIPL